MIITITSGLELFLYPAAVTRYSDQTGAAKHRDHDGAAERAPASPLPGKKFTRSPAQLSFGRI